MRFDWTWSAWTWLVKRALLFIAALLGLGPAATAQPAASTSAAPTPARPATGSRTNRGPAMWLIERGTTKIYLFGTVHVFPARLQWRTPILDQVIREADELVLETPDAADDSVDGDRMMRPMRLGKSVSILSRVSPEARPALQAMIGQTGLPMSVYDGLTTWGVGFMLTSFALRSGTDEHGQQVATTGAEEVLSRAFRKRQRPIYGVETIEDQLNVFATMPFSAQRRFLESTVLGQSVEEAQAAARTAGTRGTVPAAAAAAPQQQDSTEAAWLAGNVEGVGAEMQTMPREMYEPLLVRRNANWTRWLEARLQRPGTVLFAVGAGHLAGPDSVQAMLAARGITARRIN